MARRYGCGRANAKKLANELGLDITVSHLPPGTSKWNKIEQRPFSFISQNWRAQPLVSYRVIVKLISATTTKPASPCAVSSTLAYTPTALSCPTPRWPPPTSNGPSSTASGTTPSHRIAIRQTAHFFLRNPKPVFVDCGPLPAGSSRNDNTILPHYVLAWISQTRLAGPALRTPRLDELIPLFPCDQRKSQRGRS